MKALLIDDEKAARARLRRLLGRHKDIEIIGEAEDGIQALAKVATLRPDLLFLDIEMPALDGIGVARALGSNGPRVVFVTAYDDFALAAFESAAVDYLVKPVTDERLGKTVNRLKAGQRPIASALDELEKKRPSRRFAVKSGAEYHLVDIATVTAIIAEDNYAVVKGGKEILCDETLDALSARLDAQRFLRVHRSAIVNVTAVQRLEREGDRKYVLVLTDGQRVAISRDRLGEVKEALGIGLLT